MVSVSRSSAPDAAADQAQQRVAGGMPEAAVDRVEPFESTSITAAPIVAPPGAAERQLQPIADRRGGSASPVSGVDLAAAASSARCAAAGRAPCGSPAPAARRRAPPCRGSRRHRPRSRRHRAPADRLRPSRISGVSKPRRCASRVKLEAVPAAEPVLDQGDVVARRAAAAPAQPRHRRHARRRNGCRSARASSSRTSSTRPRQPRSAAPAAGRRWRGRLAQAGGRPPASRRRRGEPRTTAVPPRRGSPPRPAPRHRPSPRQSGSSPLIRRSEHHLAAASLR